MADSRRDQVYIKMLYRRLKSCLLHFAKPFSALWLLRSFSIKAGYPERQKAINVMFWRRRLKFLPNFLSAPHFCTEEPFLRSAWAALSNEPLAKTGPLGPGEDIEKHINTPRAPLSYLRGCY